MHWTPLKRQIFRDTASPVSGRQRPTETQSSVTDSCQNVEVTKRISIAVNFTSLFRDI
jgi:hypothetical protein